MDTEECSNHRGLRGHRWWDQQEVRSMVEVWLKYVLHTEEFGKIAIFESDGLRALAAILVHKSVTKIEWRNWSYSVSHPY